MLVFKKYIKWKGETTDEEYEYLLKAREAGLERENERIILKREWDLQIERQNTEAKMKKQNAFTAVPNPARNAPVVFDKPISIVGLMGSGKSVIGRRLAKQLGLTFADSDELVKNLAGVSITDIFDLAGEAKFREMELRAIQNQLQQEALLLNAKSFL